MQLESRILPTFGAAAGNEPTANRREMAKKILAQQAQSAAKPTPRETKLDILFAAIVIGLTVQFISFVLGLVTEIFPRVLDAALVSILIGLCAMGISYALMKESD
jgi:hypothetical protein